MANNFLTQQIASFRMSLFVEGFLGEQFTELEKLDDDQNPLFIERVVNVFLKETPNEITRIGQILEDTPLDVVKLDRCIHKLKGSSVSIGAKRVHTEMDNMLACFREDYIHIGGIRVAFSRLKEEFAILKDKLEAYLGLLQALRPPEQPSESADSNSPINEGTSTSRDREEGG